LYFKDELFAQLNYSEEFFDDYMKHSHDMLALSVLEQGKISISYATNDIEILSTNSIAIFNPNEVHLSKKSDDLVENYYTLYLDVNWCIQLQKKLKLSQNDFILFNRHIINDKNESNKLLQICKNINNDEEKDYHNIIKEFCKNIFKKYTIKNEVLTKEKELANKVKIYIHENINSKISLHDISKDLSYDSRHIIRVFKKQFNLSPMAYIQNIKINNSKDLLLKDDSLCDVANKSGFYDQSHFSKNFKKVFAISPGKYKD